MIDSIEQKEMKLVDSFERWKELLNLDKLNFFLMFLHRAVVNFCIVEYLTPVS